VSLRGANDSLERMRFVELLVFIGLKTVWGRGSRGYTGRFGNPERLAVRFAICGR
jgi:hypothetical protein